LADAGWCQEVVRRTVGEFGGLDLLVNNVATQWPVDSPEDLTEKQWMRTFDVNIHSYFRVTAAALPHMPRGSAIINTGSVNGLRGNKTLIDYSATKGAVHSWTYAMAQALVDRGIRINCVAPGPVWTPLIPSTFPPEKVEGFGKQAPFHRPAQPDELAPSYVFLAAERLSSYYTGEVLAALGGETTPG
jgi:NAD(P)-dependent dehydrogenase (short-subunit alcohol dehydrogenase family)